MRCRERSWSFDEAIPIYSYKGEAQALIAAYKFGSRISLADFLAGRLEAELAARWPGRPVVPVPFRRAKIRERGWDQVEELARRLERGGRRVMRILERLPSGEQKKLGLEERFGNAARAYRVR
jgi:predicted amidophosphoribosyltransferase